MSVTGVVALLSIAPVKGLGLLHPGSVELTPTGVPGDRRYALVDAGDRLANGKRLGPLVRVRPVPGDDPESLVLVLPDGREVGGEVVLGDRVAPLFYGEPRPAHLVLGPYAAALSELAGQPLTLVRMDEGEGVDRGAEGAVTLLSQGALDAMAAAAAVGSVDTRRFRMTFTLDGVGPHAEDAWIGRRVRVGGAVLRPAGNVGRCAVTTQDPDTGLKSLDTLRLIADTRGAVPTTEPLPFGVHAEVLEPGRVALGDEVVPLD